MMRTLAFLVMLTVALTSACKETNSDIHARAVTGGDPKRGADSMRRYGCGTCHTIPGVVGANALVGPPLGQYARRAYVAGVLPNTPENLQQWIMHPRALAKTAMPEMGVSPEDARDMAAYLYTLE